MSPQMVVVVGFFIVLVLGGFISLLRRAHKISESLPEYKPGMEVSDISPERQVRIVYVTCRADTMITDFFLEEVGMSFEQFELNFQEVTPHLAYPGFSDCLAEVVDREVWRYLPERRPARPWHRSLRSDLLILNGPHRGRMYTRSLPHHERWEQHPPDWALILLKQAEVEVARMTFST